MRRLVSILVLLFLAGASFSFERFTIDSYGRTSSRGIPTLALIESTSVEPGGVIRLFVPDGRELSAELRTQDGGLVARAVPAVMRLGEVARMVALLLPVDSTVTSGAYALHLRDGSGLERRIQIDVVRRDFLTQEIELDRRLTLLRSVPDPEKTRQTAELTRLILSADPGAVYHTGALEWPLPLGTRETSQFGVRRRFVYSDGSDARTIHVGIDLAAPDGTAIVSSGGGVVRMAEFRIVTGWTVVIEHLPGVYTLYYHLSGLDVEPGQVVSSGETIGSVGATGLATGAHLHWEVRVGGVPVDPVALTRRSLLWRG